MHLANKKLPVTTTGKTPKTVNTDNTPQRSTIRVTAVVNHPVTPSGAKKSGDTATPLRPCPPRQAALEAAKLRRTQSANAQQNPGTVPATMEERINAIRQQLPKNTAGVSFTEAVQMMRKLANLGNELHQEKKIIGNSDPRYGKNIREGGVILGMMDTIMNRAKEQLYVEQRLNIKKSSSLKYRLFAKIPGTRQFEVELSLKYLDNIRRKMAIGKK